MPYGKTKTNRMAKALLLLSSLNEDDRYGEGNGVCVVCVYVCVRGHGRLLLVDGTAVCSINPISKHSFHPGSNCLLCLPLPCLPTIGTVTRTMVHVILPHVCFHPCSLCPLLPPSFAILVIFFIIGGSLLHLPGARFLAAAQSSFATSSHPSPSWLLT